MEESRDPRSHNHPNLPTDHGKARFPGRRRGNHIIPTAGGQKFTGKMQPLESRIESKRKTLCLLSGNRKWESNLTVTPDIPQELHSSETFVPLEHRFFF